jgi:hypothetical protein
MNYDSFSHGQIKSKLWLCEKLEPYIANKKIVVLGGWYNIIAFMLLSRGNHIEKITSIDVDTSVAPIANKINDLWVIEGIVENITGNANNIPVQHDVIINCSSEHMDIDWFDQIRPGTIVCIQSSNIIDPNDPWFIKTASPDIESFKQKYNLSKTLFCDTLRIQYDSWGYDRYMIIGIK